MRCRPKEMSYTMSKSLSERQDIRLLYTIPLLTPDKRVFGLVGIQFDHDTPEDELRIEAGLCAACEDIEAIEFFLANKPKPPTPWYRRLFLGEKND